MNIFRRVYKNIPRTTFLAMLPQIEEEKKQTFLSFSLTIIALIFFGLFAISPTLTTIAQLQKQVDDSLDFQNKLNEKITNLGILQKKYQSLGTVLPVVFRAVPKKAQAPFFAAQLQEIARISEVKINQLSISPIDLTLTTPTQQPLGYSVFSFSFAATGSGSHVLEFLKTLSYFDRIITLSDITITQESSESDNLQLNLNGQVLFKP